MDAYSLVVFVGFVLTSWAVIIKSPEIIKAYSDHRTAMIELRHQNTMTIKRMDQKLLESVNPSPTGYAHTIKRSKKTTTTLT